MDGPRVALAVAAGRRADYLRGFGALLAIALVGLSIVKWGPYLDKALGLAAGHAFAPSPVFGAGVAPPPPSIAAAVDYSVGYFRSVWQAMVLGLLLAATIETLLPRDWLARVLGSASARSSMLGGLLALPGMMCTCCAAPVAVALRRSGASVGSSVALFLGNPTLNPSVLVFLALALGWQWAALRLVLGIGLVFGAAALATRLTRSQVDGPTPLAPPPEPAYGTSHWLSRWIRSLTHLSVRLLPEYLVIVALLGAGRAFLFPIDGLALGNDPLLLVGLAVAGMLFVIPTAGEIPIIQAMLTHGLGPGPAGVLLLTLAPISLPSLVMVARTFPPRVVGVLAVATAGLGLASGLLAATLGLG